MFRPDTVQLWLAEQAAPIAYLVGAVFTGFVLVKISAVRRQNALRTLRAGHTEEIFVQHLTGIGFDVDLCSFTYRYLQTKQKIGFPILFSDRLDEDLGLDHEDVEETRTALAAHLDRDLRPGLRHAPIITVEDLMRFIQAAPRRKDKVA